MDAGKSYQPPALPCSRSTMAEDISRTGKKYLGTAPRLLTDARQNELCDLKFSVNSECSTVEPPRNGSQILNLLCTRRLVCSRRLIRDNFGTFERVGISLIFRVSDTRQSCLCFYRPALQAGGRGLESRHVHQGVRYRETGPSDRQTIETTLRE